MQTKSNLFQWQAFRLALLPGMLPGLLLTLMLVGGSSQGAGHESTNLPPVGTSPTASLTNGAAGDDPAEAAKDSLGERGSYNFSDMGAWIWDTNTFDRQTVRFWKSFEIPAGARVLRSRLRITADNEYIL